MKTFNCIQQAEKADYEEIGKKSGAGKFLKLVLFLFMLSWMVVLTSCFVRGPGHERHEDRNEHHGDNDHHDHHDNDDHH
jgi:hypothetical protein